MDKYINICKKHLIQPNVPMYNQLQSILFTEYPSEALRLGNPNPTALIHMLQNIPQLKEITLSNAQFQESFPHFLIALKQGQPKLKKLALPEAHLNHLDTKTLFQALQHMEYLEILELSHVDLNCNAVSESRLGIKSLTIKNSTLKDLSGLRAFILHQRNLIHLDLSGTDLSSASSDIVQLCIDLLARKAETINLSYCGIKKKEVKAILPLVLNNSWILGFWLDGQVTSVEQKQLEAVLIRNQRQFIIKATNVSYQQQKITTSPKNGIITLDDV